MKKRMIIEGEAEDITFLEHSLPGMLTGRSCIWWREDHNPNSSVKEQILSFLRHSFQEPHTVISVSKALSISSVTVRKCLNDLAEQGILSTREEYHRRGRPLRLYFYISGGEQDETDHFDRECE